MVFHLLHDKFKNSFRIRMFVLYSSIVTLSLSILLCLFIGYQNSRFELSKKQSGETSLTQFQDFTDQYFLTSVYNIITRDLYANNKYSLSFVDNDDNYVYNFHDFSPTLDLYTFANKLANKEPFIESVTFYNKKYDTYINSKSGSFYSVSKNTDKYKDYVNFDLIDFIIERNKDTQKFIPPEVNTDFYPDKNILSLLQSLPVFASNKDADIYLILNLNLDQIYSSFFAKIDSTTSSYGILDSNQNILFDTSPKSISVDSLEPDLLETITSTDSGYEKLKIDGKPYVIIWTPSAQNDWKFFHILPDIGLLATLNDSWYALIIGFVGIFVLVMLAIWFITTWLYTPLYNLVSISKSKLKDTSPKSDILTINEAFLYINKELSTLESIVEKNNGLILNNIVLDLLHNCIRSRDELNERLQILNVSFPFDSFYILLIQIDPTTYHSLTYEEKELLHITIMDMLEQFYGTQNTDILKTATMFNYDGHFILIANLNRENYEKEKSETNELLLLLNNHYSAIFNIFITKAFEEFDEFHTLYKQTVDYFKYNYIYGCNNIFTQDIISSYEEHHMSEKTEPVKNFESHLKSHIISGIKADLDAAFEEIKLKGYSYIYTYNLGIRFINLLANESALLNINDPELTQRVLLEQYAAITSIQAYLLWFHGVIDQFGSAVEVRNTNIDNSFIQSILDFIKENIDAQISLNSVADHFGLSTGHLSRLFKEKVGTNFVDYITTIKFEMAAKLLLSNSKIKISDIASQLGYSNLTYFTKLFKEKYGVTPTQYRKMNSDSTES